MTSLTEFFNKHEDDALKGITHKNSIIKRNIIAHMAVNGECTLSELTKAIVLDKKNLNDHLNIILLHNVGDSYIYPATTAFFTENDRII